MDRIRDDEGIVHFASVGVQHAATLCYMLLDCDGQPTTDFVTCNDCAGIVRDILKHYGGRGSLQRAQKHCLGIKQND